jgi:hypothetical protein
MIYSVSTSVVLGVFFYETDARDYCKREASPSRPLALRSHPEGMQPRVGPISQSGVENGRLIQFYIGDLEL